MYICTIYYKQNVAEKNKIKEPLSEDNKGSLSLNKQAFIKTDPKQ